MLVVSWGLIPEPGREMFTSPRCVLPGLSWPPPVWVDFDEVVFFSVVHILVSGEVLFHPHCCSFPGVQREQEGQDGSGLQFGCRRRVLTAFPFLWDEEGLL